MDTDPALQSVSLPGDMPTTKHSRTQCSCFRWCQCAVVTMLIEVISCLSYILSESIFHKTTATMVEVGGGDIHVEHRWHLSELNIILIRYQFVLVCSIQPPVMQVITLN